MQKMLVHLIQTFEVHIIFISVDRLLLLEKRMSAVLQYKWAGAEIFCF